MLDQTTPLFDIPFFQTLSSNTIAVDTVVDAYTFTANVGHSFAVDDEIAIPGVGDTNFMLSVVVGVVGEVITITTPFTRAYPAGSTAIVINTNMVIDGSVTPQVFSVTPSPGREGDVVRIILTIDGNAAMDFSTFGTAAALTRGILLRINNGDGTFRNIMQWRDNGEFIERSFDHTFLSPKGGNVTHSFVSRRTFGGQSKNGVVVRLNGNLGESLEVVIQDNTNGDNSEIRVYAQGHFTQ